MGPIKTSGKNAIRPASSEIGGIQYLANGSCATCEHTSTASSNYVEGKTVEVGYAFSGGFPYESSATLTGMSDDGFQAVHLNSVYGAYFQTKELILAEVVVPAQAAGA